VTLKVLSTLAVQGALPALIADYERAVSTRVTSEFAPTNGLLARIRAGEAADIALLTRGALDDLETAGTIAAGSIVDIALSEVGVAVKAGAPKPDISSVAALNAALLATQSIAYSRIGASGVFFAGLIERLGIADAVNAKARIIPTGFTAELAASGEVELAVQQISELLMVPGIEVAGPLPAGAESITMFSGGILARSSHTELAAAFLAHLRSQRAVAALTAAGLRAARSFAQSSQRHMGPKGSDT
jgi:molybdate transport system substrate-binding protein